MVQFRLNNSLSKYSSTSPCLVSLERAISILAYTSQERLSFTIYFNGDFRPPSSSQAATGTSFASPIGRMSQTAHSGDLVMACLRFRGFSLVSLQTRYFSALLGISSKIMEYVMLQMIAKLARKDLEVSIILVFGSQF